MYEPTEIAEVDSCEDLGATGNLPLNKPPMRPSIMSTGSKKEYNAELEYFDSVKKTGLNLNYALLEGSTQEKKFLEDVTRSQEQNRKSFDI